MNNQNTAAAAEPTSPARVILAGRINACVKAANAVKDLQRAMQRAQDDGREAARLEAAMAADQQRVVDLIREHALRGEAVPPDLIGEDRLKAVLKHAEAKARAEAAAPVQERIAAEMALANQAFVGAGARAAQAVDDVLIEETDALAARIAELHAQVLPLHTRLAGLRSWALDTAHRSGTSSDQGRSLLSLAERVVNLMPNLGVSLQTKPEDTDAEWAAFAQRLVNDHQATFEA
ncbi:hypothetical protein [Methylobacterium soli]|uniref:Uncharacterized protein n=1 Tax=Methylobacterium soli TaxID=553447 RepID=A0A6L3SQ21_9HYPH|nr:hypothetical protein [Methylobacterium soli]KAB1072551.1 hypothetical protein F6X53_28110 [Methylobacterium soli]GJE43830.1 hypothetical protein AEGHOMDF_3009 [Methylobacterium soli]